jgi:hypothetical protein
METDLRLVTDGMTVYTCCCGYYDRIHCASGGIPVSVSERRTWVCVTNDCVFHEQVQYQIRILFGGACRRLPDERV